MNPSAMTRRDALRLAGAAAMAPWLAGAASPPVARPKVAAVFTEFAYRKHAHVILENFLNPYLFNGKPTDPGVDVVSFYADQFPADDMAREVAATRKIPIFPTIAGALTLGGKSLAVDGVLSIAEHGTYPTNAKGQVEYPRKRFFDEIVAVFEASGRSVPVFNDKHLSYRWEWAREMADTAARLDFPLMAGSSVPLAQRRPAMEMPDGATIRQAVSIHGGPVESYDFHGLEVLQSIVEARKRGESGVVRVQFLDEPALMKSAEAGEWSIALADAAMKAELGAVSPGFRALAESKKLGSEPSHGILIDYADGFRGVMLKLGSSGIRWNFATQVEGQPAPISTSFYVGPWQNRNLFKALSHAIQVMFREGKAPYPPERTLLTTGILDAAMTSRAEGGKALDTPNLAIRYAPIDFRRVREMGATWDLITDATPEPKGLDTIR